MSLGDEHITRAARALHENDCSCGEWDKMLPESRGYWLTRARVVLDAAGAVGDVTPPPDAPESRSIGVCWDCSSGMQSEGWFSTPMSVSSHRCERCERISHCYFFVNRAALDKLLRELA